MLPTARREKEEERLAVNDAISYVDMFELAKRPDI
jgi:hypothetical protein